MLLVPVPDGHVVVAQPAHGLTCGQIGREWGNDLVGDVTPRDVVVRAAELHDEGWAEWERSPTLDRATGLPHTFATAPFTVHLVIHSAWARELAARDPYAGLLVALHHASFFPRPGPAGRLRRSGRQIAAFLDELDGLERRVRSALDVDDEEVERNRRLVRTWDGISHDLLVNALPRVRKQVPAREGVVDLMVARADEHYVVAPWPFATDAVTVRTEGRLLRKTYIDEDEMRAALVAAPTVGLTYELRPA